MQADLPGGWEELPLADVADITMSPVDKKSTPGQPAARLCNYVDVYKHEYLSDDHDYMVATASLMEIDRYGLRNGDVVITKDSETAWDIGVPVVLEDVKRPLVCGYHLAIIRPRSRVNPVFLAKQLAHDRIRRYFAKEANGITRYGLTSAGIRNTPLWLPPRRVQDAFAAALRSLDETIRKTEQVIAKLEQVKQGLLHDLLTRGLDQHGELRDPDRHPEQFKDSPLGRIPRGWEVALGADICLRIEVGIVIRPTQYYAIKGVPVLRSANVREGRIELSDLKFMSERDHALMSKTAVTPGDLVTVRTGYPGTTAVIPAGLTQANCVDIIISRPGPRVLPDYLSTWVNSDTGKGQVLRVQGGLAVTGRPG